MSNNGLLGAITVQFPASQVGRDVCLSFFSDNDEGIAFILSPESRVALENIIRNNFQDGDLEALNKAVEANHGAFKALFNEQYNNFYPYRYAGAHHDIRDIAQPKDRLEIAFKNIVVQHSHADDKGKTKERHEHKIDITINLAERADGQAVIVSGTAMAALQNTINELKLAFNDGQSMEELGQVFCAKAAPILRADGQEIACTEMRTPYDNSHDHPGYSKQETIDTNFITILNPSYA